MPLHDAHIAQPLGTLESDPDYVAGKAGDLVAAVAVASRFVTDEMAARYAALDNPLVLGVVSIEATGHNAIPQAAAAVLASKLNATLCVSIVQADSPRRTQLLGLDRIFRRPEFDGAVQAGRSYLLVDDTLTQGGTFAALTEHIESHGGTVKGVIALSGKQYSSKIQLSEQTLTDIRTRFGDLENDFATATGRRFDALTESEARYLVKFKQADTVRARILEEAGGGPRASAGAASGLEAQRVDAADRLLELESTLGAHAEANDRYMHGDCHIFALALRQISGRALMAALDRDPEIEGECLVHAGLAVPGGIVDVMAFRSLDEAIEAFPTYAPYWSHVDEAALLNLGEGSPARTASIDDQVNKALPAAKVAYEAALEQMSLVHRAANGPAPLEAAAATGLRAETSNAWTYLSSRLALTPAQAKKPPKP